MQTPQFDSLGKLRRALDDDLFRIRPGIFWVDFGSATAFAWIAFWLTLPRFSPGLPERIFWFAFSIVGFYRALIFVHELAHTRSEKLRSFRLVWNLLCGSMFFLPEFTYSIHRSHHLTATFSTSAVVGAGWSQLRDSDLPEHILLLKSVDHSRLFPQCRALVHHGGAGTTYLGLLSGKPTVVYSVFAEQPFWGERLKKAGAGTHFRFNEFSETTLLSGLRHVLQPGVRDMAEQLGKQLDPEAGAASSVAEISRYLQAGPSGWLPSAKAQSA